MLDRIRIGGVSLLEWVGVVTPGGITRADIEGATGGAVRRAAVPWVQLDNVVVGALIGLVGIVCGNLISGWSQRRVEHEHSRLPELILAFDAMKTELERLILKVDRLEKDLEAATLDLDQTRARYRAALSWGHKLQRIIEDLLLTLPKGTTLPFVPDPPSEITSDI